VAAVSSHILCCLMLPSGLQQNITARLVRYSMMVPVAIDAGLMLPCWCRMMRVGTHERTQQQAPTVCCSTSVDPIQRLAVLLSWCSSGRPYVVLPGCIVAAAAQVVHETHHLLSPTAVPLTQQQQAGPGFGEAALLRCFLAVQPPGSTNSSHAVSSVPLMPVSAQLLPQSSMPALPVASPWAVRSGTAAPPAAVLSPVTLALPRSCPDQNRLVQAVLAASGANPHAAVAATATIAACSGVVHAPCVVLRYGRC
jgi:hypothetical protein